MKILAEPTRLENLIKGALFFKSKPIPTAFAAEFGEKGLYIKSKGYTVLIHVAMYKPSYFLEYQTNNEVVPITETLLNKLRGKEWGFKQDPNVALESNDGEVILENKKHRYTEEKEEVETFDLKMELELTDWGLLPKGTPPLRVKIKSDDFKLPPAETCIIEPTKEEFKVSIEGENSQFTKKISYTETDQVSDGKMKLDCDYLARIFENVSGDVWISFIEGAFIVSQSDKEHAKTFVLSTITL